MSADSDSDCDAFEVTGTPPEITNLAEEASSNLLPCKSKTRYETTYEKFMKWRAENNINSYSENVLMAYFGHLTQHFKPSSLWAIYSMLRSVLNIRNNVNIATYPKLRAYLKRQGDGFKSKKSKILTPDQIKEFIHAAPDSEYLLTKTILIIGISGACRKQELKNLRVTDLEDSGKILHFKIPDTKTKITRSFVISGTFYKICKQYIALRQRLNNPNITQFFLNYQKGKCTQQLVGINKIGNVPRKVAEYLKLPNSAAYTGHCMRRTSATILVDAGGDLMSLKRHGGWRSSTTAEGYVDDSLANKALTATKILNSIENKPNDTNNNLGPTSSLTKNTINAVENIEIIHHSSITPSTSQTVQESKTPIVIQHCHNFTINYR